MSLSSEAVVGGPYKTSLPAVKTGDCELGYALGSVRMGEEKKLVAGWGCEKDPAGTGLAVKASPGRHMAKIKCLFCPFVTPCSNTGHPEFEL